jgi:hypothetical protein
VHDRTVPADVVVLGVEVLRDVLDGRGDVVRRGQVHHGRVRGARRPRHHGLGAERDKQRAGDHARQHAQPEDQLGPARPPALVAGRRPGLPGDSSVHDIPCS